MGGSTLFGAAGIEEYGDDTEFLQDSQNDDPETWVPKGTPSLNDELVKAQNDQQVTKLKDDGLSGDSVLGAAIGKKGALVDSGDSDDFGEDEMLVRLPTEAEEAWTPSGQSGLSEALDAAHAEEEKSAIKDDGLQGNDVLSAVLDETVAPVKEPEFELMQETEKGLRRGSQGSIRRRAERL